MLQCVKKTFLVIGAGGVLVRDRARPGRLKQREPGMRKLIYVMSLAFALGGLAPLAHAGEGCDYSGKVTKKNDLETPPPATASATKKNQS